MTTRRKHTRYDAEFKESAVKLVQDSDKSAYQVANELGVNINTLYSWIRKYGSTNPSKAGSKIVVNESIEDENRRLRKELKRVTEEREIFKKATVESTRQCNTFFFDRIYESRDTCQVSVGQGCQRSRKLSYGGAGN